MTQSGGRPLTNASTKIVVELTREQIDLIQCAFGMWKDSRSFGDKGEWDDVDEVNAILERAIA